MMEHDVLVSLELVHGVQVGVPALNKCYARVRTRIVDVTM